VENKLIIGLLFFILLFFAPMWAINKLDRVKTDEVINNHANSLLFIIKEHKEMQIDIARLVESNDRLEKRVEKKLKEYKAVTESFTELVREKFPNFIKEVK